MTALAATSDRLAGARRFGLELRRAMSARRMTERSLAEIAGLGRSQIGNWKAGTSSPSVASAQRLADVLMWPRLADIATEIRTLACHACGRTFVADTQAPRRYCSADCRRFQNTKRVPARRDLSRAVMERRVVRYQAAVAAMCGSCEPDGKCRTASCPLQLAGVSTHGLERGAVA